jgi:selenocysteine lyase/cysteine desulfurase
MARFIERYPEYAATRRCDHIRAVEYARLDACGQTYLDFTGAGLHAESHVAAHLELLRGKVFGNPHSTSPASHASTEHVECARARVLEFFHADPREYDVVFTSNATGAIRLVGESYPWRRGGELLLTADNHNSVNGIGEFARAGGAHVSYVPLVAHVLRADEARLLEALGRRREGCAGLLAYPAQSNFSGVQHPLEWIEAAHAAGWDVLLDAAAFVPTSRLDLSAISPDFVPISFYKMFGYPTGVGCLLARHEALRKLVRPWYGGGTLTFASVLAESHCRTPGGRGFEDGTLDFLAIPAITAGFDLLDRVGMDVIGTRVACLTTWLLERLEALHHPSGAPLVSVYGPRDGRKRGGTVAFNVLATGGRTVDCHAVVRRAGQRGISLRAGCHCNPGAREAALGVREHVMRECFRDKDVLSHAEFKRRIEGKNTGVVRASLGMPSNLHDVQHLVSFLAEYAGDRAMRDTPHSARAVG